MKPILTTAIAILGLVAAGCQYDSTARPIVPRHDSSIGLYARVMRGESFLSDLGTTGKVRMIVTRVAPGGPAEKAGIYPGALLLKIDGHNARDAASLIMFVRNLEPGRMVKVKIYQNGKRKTVSVLVKRSRDVWGWSQPNHLKRPPADILEKEDGDTDATSTIEVPGIHAY